MERLLVFAVLVLLTLGCLFIVTALALWRAHPPIPACAETICVSE